MCLIIDANRASDFSNLSEPYLKPLLEWVRRGGKIVSGGQLERELVKIAVMRDLLAEWSRRGNLFNIPAPLIDDQIAQLGQIKSNDPHVVALARISGASLVVTEDGALMSDLKNTAVVGFRRKIYKRDKHRPDNIRNHRKLVANLDCP